MKFTSVLLSALCVGLAIAGSGCLEMHQELRLKSDLSGSVSMKVVYDLDLMSEGIVLAMSSMGGKAPKMPPEQLEGMKQMMLQNMKAEMSKNFLTKEEIEEQLPEEGVRLESMEMGQKGNIMRMDVKFAFDHISNLDALRKIKLDRGSEGQQMAPGMSMGSSSSNPYEKLTIEEIDGYLVISDDIAQDFDPKKTSQMPPHMQGLFKKMGDKGVFLRIRWPYQAYELVKHTADRVDEKSHTLYWLYTFERLQDLAQKGKLPEPVYVKMRRR